MERKLAMAKIERAMKYIRAIRNPGKKAYALAYLGFLNGEAPPDEGGFGIGIMARGAVRLRINELI